MCASVATSEVCMQLPEWRGVTVCMPGLKIFNPESDFFLFLLFSLKGVWKPGKSCSCGAFAKCLSECETCECFMPSCSPAGAGKCFGLGVQNLTWLQGTPWGSSWSNGLSQGVLTCVFVSGCADLCFPVSGCADLCVSLSQCVLTCVSLSQGVLTCVSLSQGVLTCVSLCFSVSGCADLCLLQCVLTCVCCSVW